MTPEKYTEWARMHAELFGLRDAADARLVSLWAPCLMPFDFEELRDASYAVAVDPRDMRRFRENHLSMLREAILAKRAEVAGHERDRLDAMYSRAECNDCFGVGLVRVPHPDFLLDEEMQRGFFIVVACLCPSGIARFNGISARLTEAEANYRIIDLAQYEALHPDWRRILAARQQTQANEFDVAEFARNVDRIAPINPADIKKAGYKGKS
jgi:hypothetical protein